MVARLDNIVSVDTWFIIIIIIIIIIILCVCLKGWVLLNILSACSTVI